MHLHSISVEKLKIKSEIYKIQDRNGLQMVRRQSVFIHTVLLIGKRCLFPPIKDPILVSSMALLLIDFAPCSKPLRSSVNFVLGHFFMFSIAYQEGGIKVLGKCSLRYLNLLSTVQEY